MLKKTITYTDFNGEKVSEDFYFNLSKAEIAEMELSHRGGFSAYLQQIIETEDGAQIIAAFKRILTTSVGQRSEDGRRFIKNEEITNDFLQSEAYSELFMELVTDGNKAAEFIQAIVPADMAEAVADGSKLAAVPEGKEMEEEIPAYILENREPTPKELQEMSPDEIREAFRKRQQRNK